MLETPLILPAGWSFRRPSLQELRDRGNILDLFTIWEPPRRHGPRRYVVGVDTSDALDGGDLSAVEVLRVGTLQEPAEQVAQFITNSIQPGPLAYVVAAIGQYYRDEDGVEAKVAVERTHHGLSTIDTLHLHLGYTNQYTWEYYDVKDPTLRFSTVLGWSTTPRSRPPLVDKFRTAVTTYCPVTNQPDLIINSPYTLDELQDFQTEGALWEAAAARGAHDDSLIALAIAYIVSWRLQAGETEPLEDRRRRRAEQQAILEQAAKQPVKLDYRNTPFTATQVQNLGGVPTDGELEERIADLRAMDDTLDEMAGRW